MAVMCTASFRTSSPSREACLPTYPGSPGSLLPSRIERKIDSIPGLRTTRNTRNSRMAGFPRISRIPRLCRAGIGSGQTRLGFQSLECVKITHTVKATQSDIKATPRPP